MLVLEDLFVFIFIGIFAGSMSGLLGIGGGTVVVPGLAFAYQIAGYSPDAIMHLAVGTSLAVMVFTAQASFRAHHRISPIDWSIYFELLPGIVIGTVSGAIVADHLHTHLLSVLFGVFLVIVSMRTFLSLHTKPSRTLPNRFFMFVIGLIIGGKSGLLGIGGGVLTIPFLIYCNVPLRKVFGISTLCSLSIALVGATSHMIAGLDQLGPPSLRTGYVYWPAVAAVALPSMFMAPIAAKWSHRVPEDVLKRVFAVLLLVIGVHMLF